MKTSLRWRRRRTAFASICALLAVAIGLVALAGWVTGVALMPRFVHRSEAITPLTAALMVVLGAALGVSGARPGSRAAALAAAWCGAIGCAVGLLLLAGVRLDDDVARQFPAAAHWIGIMDAPVGRLTEVAALTWVLVGFSIATLCGGFGPPILRDAAAALATVVAVGSAASILGLTYGVIPRVGAATLPISLPGGLAFMLVATSALAGAQPRIWPARAFSGSTARARLLRVMVPTVCITMLARDQITLIIGHFWHISPGLWSGLTALGGTALTVGFVWIVVGQIGRELDNALRRARGSEARLSVLFQSAPLPIWELDISAVKAQLDVLRASGVDDLGTYLRSHPELLRSLSAQLRVVDVNYEGLRSSQVSDKREIADRLRDFFVDETWATVAEGIIAFAGGARRFAAETISVLPGGKRRHIILQAAIADGCEETWSRVMTSFPDITQQKEAELQLLLRDRIAGILLSTPDERLYADVLAAVRDELDSPRGGFGYVSTQGDLVVPAMDGVSSAVATMHDDLPVYPRSTWIGVWKAALGQGVSAMDNDPHGVPGTDILFRRSLAVPLVHAGGVVGLLAVSDKASDYTDEDVVRLERIAGMVAPVLHARIERDAREEDRDRIARQLVASEERFRMLFEHAPVSYHSLGADDTVVEVNRTWLQTLGYDRQEVIGRWFGDFVAPEDREHFKERFSGARQLGFARGVELGLARKDGSVILVSMDCDVAHDAEGRSTQAHCTYQDITSRRLAEREIQRTNALFRGIAEGTSDIVYVKDLDGRYQMLNSAGVEKSGLPLERIIGRTDAELFGPADAARVADVDQLVIREGRVLTYETEVSLAGARRTLLVVKGPVRYEDGEMAGIFGIARDITGRKEMEEAIRRERDRAQMYLDTAGTLMLALDLDARVTLVNKRACQLLGYEESELLGRDWFEVCAPASQQAKRHMRFDQMAQGAAPEFMNGEIELLTRAGEPRIASYRSTPLVGEDGELSGMLISGEDVTERRRVEAHLQQSQKLEAVGTLASGVAHEINNPINGIINYAQVILDSASADERIREYALEIQSESDRIATIVRSLLAFARQEKKSHSAADLRDVIEGTLSLVRASLRRDQIDLRVRVPELIPSIKCRSQEVQQVVLNLITNARDALNARFPRHDADKVIELDVGVVERDGRQWVRTTVADRGCGIPPDVIERVFDPFFTTKPRDKGTGLGLSISHGIVKEHHGVLSVESVEGEGTTITMDLPVDNGWELT